MLRGLLFEISTYTDSNPAHCILHHPQASQGTPVPSTPLAGLTWHVGQTVSLGYRLDKNPGSKQKQNCGQIERGNVSISSNILFTKQEAGLVLKF